MGTQTGWQPEWGWGELDLTSALAQRTSFATSNVPSYGARFYRATASAGDRATLVWNRRGTVCLTSGCQVNLLTLSNLDLQQLDATTGAVQAQSKSAIDNVEQVRSPGAGQVIYKVKATSNVDGLAGEPFALASTHPPTPLATPQPTATVQISKAQLKPGQTATVTATAHNPSADLTGETAQLALNLPTGLQLEGGSQTQALGTLATNGSGGDTATASWTIKAVSDVAGQVTATAQASRYGETFTGTAMAGVSVDGTAPAPTLAAPAGEITNSAIGLSWGGTDAGSGVDHYDVEVSTNGVPFAPWQTATTATSATFSGAPGNRYAFRVRAADRMGNLSGYATSAEIRIAEAAKPAPPPGGGGSTPPPPGTSPGTGTAATSPALRLVRATRSRLLLVLVGSVAHEATGKVVAVYTLRTAHKTFRVRARVSVSRGRFKARLRIPSGARAVRRGTLALAYQGDKRFRRQSLRLSLHSH